MKDAKLIYISTDELYEHPNNPRKNLGDLTELAESIKSSGVMQNLTVVPRNEGGYTVIIGHRRLGASKLAGIESVPCVIADMTEKEQLATMMLENMQRSDLTFYEQAEGFQLMISLGESIDTIADKTGLSKTTVRNRVKLAVYDKEIMREAAIRQPTFEQYMRLSEIEDIGRANEVARFLGTKNFDHECDKAISQQKEIKRQEELLNLVESAAIRYEGDVYEGVQNHKIVNVAHFYTPVTDATREKLSELKKNYKNLYYNKGYGFAIFRDYVPGDDDKKSEYEMNREKRISLNERADDLYEIMLARASSFVHSYKSRKDDYDTLVAHIINGVIENNLSSHYEMYRLAETLGYVMPEGAQTWEESVRMEAECYIEECFEKDKVRTMLLILWYMLPRKKPFTLLYKDTKLTTITGGGGWCRIFGILSDLGYNVSDEEWSLVYGSHPIFNEEVPI